MRILTALLLLSISGTVLGGGGRGGGGFSGGGLGGGGRVSSSVGSSSSSAGRTSSSGSSPSTPGSSPITSRPAPAARSYTPTGRYYTSGTSYTGLARYGGPTGVYPTGTRAVYFPPYSPYFFLFGSSWLLFSGANSYRPYYGSNQTVPVDATDPPAGCSVVNGTADNSTAAGAPALGIAPPPGVSDGTPIAPPTPEEAAPAPAPSGDQTATAAAIQMLTSSNITYTVNGTTLTCSPVDLSLSSSGGCKLTSTLSAPLLAAVLLLGLLVW